MNDDTLKSLQWLMQQDGSNLEAEREAFEQWLRESGRAAAHGEIERFWLDDLGALPGDEVFERLSLEALAATLPRRRRYWRSPAVWALAASAGICVFGVGAFVAGQYYVPGQTYTTAVGQRSTVQLADGSQVIMNSGTRLKVRFTGERRELTLKEGEAVFTVAEDMRRPFLVRAGDGAVTALGTRFQVRNELRQVTVTLLEGRVALDRAEQGQHMQLTPGDQIKFVTDGVDLARRTVDPKAASSWTQGYLEFKAAPLSEVLDEVNRYSQVKLRLKDREMSQEPVNGAFEIGDIASVVAALQLLLPLETSARGRNEIVLSRRSGAK